MRQGKSIPPLLASSAIESKRTRYQGRAGLRRCVLSELPIPLGRPATVREALHVSCYGSQTTSTSCQAGTSLAAVWRLADYADLALSEQRHR